MSEKQAWIIVANRENMEKVAKVGVFGNNHAALLPKMQVGDKVVAYIKKPEMAFSGIGEITQPYYIDDKSIFEGGLFHNRIGLNLKLLPENAATPMAKLVNDLEFSRGKKMWQGKIAGGVAQISMADFQKIESSITAQKIQK